MAKDKTAGKLSHEAFVTKAIVTLRSKGYKGAHSVFSGLNAAIRTYYGEDADPVKITTELASAGKIVVRPVRRGVLLYLPGEAPEVVDNRGKEAVAAILAA